MSAFGAIAVLRPEWLLALPPLLALIWRARRAQGWETVCDPALLAALAALGRYQHAAAALRPPPLLLAAALSALALSGPAIRASETALRPTQGLALLVDLSASAVGPPGFELRRDAARLAAQAAAGRQTALIVYAGDAYLAQPLTTDAAAIDATLALLDGSVVPDPGSRPARALKLARETLAPMAAQGGDAVLVSDGGGVDAAALAEAAALAGQGWRVLGLGEGLTALAEAGDGFAAPARAPRPALDALAQSAAAADEDAARAGWRDLGRHVLFAALIPAALALRRGRG